MKNFMEKYFKYAVLLLAIVALGIGIYRGDMLAVLKKAAAICMECIGIG